MLVPHRREDAELGEGRHAADQRENALIFVGLEAMRGDELGGDGGFFGNEGFSRDVRLFSLSGRRQRDEVGSDEGFN